MYADEWSLIATPPTTTKSTSFAAKADIAFLKSITGFCYFEIDEVCERYPTRT